MNAEADSQRLRLILDSTDEGIGLLAPDFTVLELNREAMRIDGRTREEVIGRVHWDAYPGTEHSELGKLYKDAMRDRVPASMRHCYHWQDGRVSWLETRVFPAADGCLAVFVRDVTEQHEATERLRQRESRLHQLGETINEVFYVHEIDQARISYVSRAYERIWGRPREELYANLQSFIDVVHPDDHAALHDALARQRGGEETDTEYRLLCDDGIERVIHDRAFVVHEPATGALRIVGLATDITEYRKAQHRLERNAETFDSLVVSNPFGIYVVDADLKIVKVSQGSQPVFAGIDPLIGRGLDEVIHILWPEPFAGEAVRRFEHTLATGEPFVETSRVEQRANTGVTEAYDWRIERLTLPDGRYGVVCYFYDLSERNAQEGRLKQALADKDLLAREIDHRVKNSLSIVGSLLSMQRSVSQSAETKAALSEAADRVVAVARVHASLHRSDELGVVAFGDYLEELCRDLAHSLRRPGVELTVQAEAINVPATTALPLALIANELITNAFKHGCAAGATQIAVDLKRDDASLTLTVEDNGGGLPAAQSTKASSLGFRLIETMARQLGGKAIIPAPGSPTRFSLKIPV